MRESFPTLIITGMHGTELQMCTVFVDYEDSLDSRPTSSVRSRLFFFFRRDGPLMNTAGLLLEEARADFWVPPRGTKPAENAFSPNILCGDRCVSYGLNSLKD